jgi:hypothetical protein
MKKVLFPHDTNLINCPLIIDQTLAEQMTTYLSKVNSLLDSIHAHFHNNRHPQIQFGAIIVSGKMENIHEKLSRKLEK